jgi:flagellin
MSGITLTASESSTILSLQQTTTLFNTTSNDLNTGKKVNSASDNALAFFQSTSLFNRASQFTNTKSQIDQNVQSLNAALNATSAVGTLLTQLQGVIQGAESATSASAKVTATQEVKTLGTQIIQQVKDASFQGINLLDSTSVTLRTQFSERTASALTVSGFNLISTQVGNPSALFTAAAGILTGTGINLGNLLTSKAGATGSFTSFTQVFTSTATGEAIFNNALNTISAAISQNQAISSALGTNVAILKARSTFSSSYAATLSSGGDKLTLADLNLESANAEALQLRQSIGVQTLSLANTQSQSILNLLR